MFSNCNVDWKWYDETWWKWWHHLFFHYWCSIKLPYALPDSCILLHLDVLLNLTSQSAGTVTFFTNSLASSSPLGIDEVIASKECQKHWLVSNFELTCRSSDFLKTYPMDPSPSGPMPVEKVVKFAAFMPWGSWHRDSFLEATANTSHLVKWTFEQPKLHLGSADMAFTNIHQNYKDICFMDVSWNRPGIHGVTSFNRKFIYAQWSSISMLDYQFQKHNSARTVYIHAILYICIYIYINYLRVSVCIYSMQ